MFFSIFFQGRNSSLFQGCSTLQLDKKLKKLPPLRQSMFHLKILHYFEGFFAHCVFYMIYLCIGGMTWDMIYLSIKSLYKSSIFIILKCLFGNICHEWLGKRFIAHFKISVKFQSSDYCGFYKSRREKNVLHTKFII